MMVKLYGQQIDLGLNPSTLCQKRWTGKLSPEPETVAWIESMNKGEVFFDIGANVGTHAIRAALRGLWSYAFEPEFQSFSELSQIVRRNQPLQVFAFPIAMSDIVGFGSLGPGRSTFTLHPISFDKQCTSIWTVDEFVKLSGVVPTHVKIDIDGDEPRVLSGMINTLPKVQSLLVEVDPAVVGHAGIPRFLKGHGFTYDEEQVNKYKVVGGKYGGLANYIFRKRK